LVLGSSTNSENKSLLSSLDVDLGLVLHPKTNKIKRKNKPKRFFIG
jgi:hypothetical protein